MSLILGILAQSGGAAVAGSSYESIATVTVGSGGQSSVSFTSIPSTYKHLQVRLFTSTNRGTFALDEMYVNFNSDTGANYSVHNLEGSGSPGATGTANTTFATSGTIPSSAAPNVFGATVLDILDYADTSKYKTTRSLNGFDLNGTVSGYGGFSQLVSSNWRNTNAITSMTFTMLRGSAFIQYSSFALYGIKGV
jgi:hypothetical protein